MLAAEEGDLEGADGLLSRALHRCPEDPEVLGEVAALRFRQGRMDEASGWALRLLELDPGSEWAWDLLGSARYLSDDAPGALRAWNRLGRPVVREVRIQGPAPGEEGGRVREEVGGAGVAPGQVLTSRRLALALRRLELLPAVADVRMDYRPLPGGEVEVEGVLRFAPDRPLSRNALPAIALRALGGQVVLSAANPLGKLERWTLQGVHEGSLAGGGVTLGMPAPAGPGVVEWSLGRSEGRFAASDEEMPLRIRRTGFRWTQAHWIRSDTHISLSGGADRWEGAGTWGSGGAALLFQPPGGAVSAGATGEGWARRDGTPAFGRASLEGGVLHPRNGRSGIVPEVDLRGGVEVVSREAPADLRPRFGGGRTATHLLRAHSHLDRDGTVRAQPLRNAWIHGGAEFRWWWPSPRALLRSVQLGLGTFVDAAGGLGGGGVAGPEEPGAVSLGAGLRARVPGVDGWLRLDWAVDPGTGTSGISAAFVPGMGPWAPPSVGTSSRAGSGGTTSLRP